jgi:hypothetical protein
MFAYDAPGRYAVPDDDEARWLVGEQAQVTTPQAGDRRLAAVSDFDLSLAPDHGADSYEAGFEDAISITRERQVARDHGSRSARRVHSVPNPDEEPTLIDVPNERPSALRQPGPSGGAAGPAAGRDPAGHAAGGARGLGQPVRRSPAAGRSGELGAAPIADVPTSTGPLGHAPAPF